MGPERAEMVFWQKFINRNGVPALFLMANVNVCYLHARNDEMIDEMNTLP